MDLRARLKSQFHKKQDRLDAETPEVAVGSTAGLGEQDVAEAMPVIEEKTVPGAGADELGDYLTPHELKCRAVVLEKLYSLLDLSRITEIDAKDARTQIQAVAHDTINNENLPLNGEARKKVTRAVEDEILGLGPLEFLLANSGISDIMVNGPDCVYVEMGGRLYKSPCVFDDDAHLMRIVDRIVSRVGRRVDESSPMVDARLEDGSRVNVIIPPLALDGAVMSIRRFPADPLTLDGLIGHKALTPDMRDLLTGAVKAGRNIIISGGTGSGKTTMLNALSAYIPDSERIVTIEDAAELQLQQSHVVRLETRPANIEGKGEVTQRDLVKNALRMRPDRIVIGEVRGAEAMDMLQAMNTGHDGSLTTIHANTARDALSRVENMVAMNGFELPTKAIRSQIASAIDLVVQVERLADGSRRVISITELIGMEGEIITMSDIFSFVRKGVDADNRFIGDYEPTGAVPTFLDDLRRRGIDLSLDIFDPMMSHESGGA